MAGKAQIQLVVDATGAIERLGEFTEGTDKASKSVKQLAKDLQTSNLSGNTLFANADFDDLTAKLQRQADALKLADVNGSSYKETVSLWRNAIKLAGESGQYTTEQLISMRENLVKAVDDMNKFKTAQTKATTTSSKFGTKLLEVGKNILGFQLAIALFRKTLTAITTTLKESVQVAAEAEQIYSKLTTVFDGYSTSAQNAAESLATTLGTANSTAASALSTIGDLLQAQGMGVADSLETAADWAKQLQDIIAFKDLDMSLEEFAETFMSGAAGNLRNFRTFGSIVKESAVNAELAKKGYDKLTGSELELAKMTTRAEMALEQQANAIGATAREWDTVLSVNRRLEEVQKQFKENLGDVLNTAVKPIKAGWAELVEYMNQAIERAQKYREIMGENSESNSQDEDNISKKILKRAEHYAKVYGEEYGDAYKNNTNLFDKLQSLYTWNYKVTAKEMDAWIQAYGASVDDSLKLMEITGFKINSEFENYLRSLENIRIANEEHAKEVERINSLLSSSNESVATVYETLVAIPGNSALKEAATITAKSVVGRDKDVDASGNNAFASELLEEGNVQAATLEAIENLLRDSLTNIGRARLTEFVDAIDVALGNVDIEDMLEGEIEALTTLFETGWNLIISNGGDPATNPILTVIKASLNGSTKAFEEYKAEKEQTESIQKDISDYLAELVQDSVEAETIAQYRSEGYSEAESKLLLERDNAVNQIINWFKSLPSNSKTEVAADGENDADITTTIDGIVYSRADMIAKANASYARQLAELVEDPFEEIKDSIASLLDAGEDSSYQGQLKQLEDLFGQLGSDTVELNGSIISLTDAQEELTEKLQKDFFENLDEKSLSSLGYVGSLVQSSIDGYDDAGIIGAIAYVAMEILEISGAFEALVEVLDPIIEAFLTPLTVVFEALGGLLGTLLQTVLTPLLPVLQAISSVIVVIFGTLNVLVGFINDIVSKITGTVMYGLTELVNWVLGAFSWLGVDKIDNSKWKDQMNIDIIQNAKDRLDDMNEWLEKIRDTGLEIADNTSSDNDDKVSAWNEMLNQGLINAEEYQGLLDSLSGVEYRDLNSADISKIDYGSTGSQTWQQNEITITIEGAGKNGEELAYEIEEALKRRGLGGNQLFA